MVITALTKPTYRIEKLQLPEGEEPKATQQLELAVAGLFEGTEFSQGSDDYLIWPKAVAFARESLDGAVLQSAREAAGWRIAAHDAESTDKYQATRTAAVYHKIDGQWYIVFDDIANPEQNIILARAQELYDAHSNKGKWILPKDDPHIKGILERAGTDRRALVHEKQLVRLSTAQDNGQSTFGQYAANKAVLQDVAEPFAQYLNNRDYDAGKFRAWSAQDLERWGLKDDEVEVRGVSLGGDGYVNGVFAYDRFHIYGGCARGTRNACDSHRK